MEHVRRPRRAIVVATAATLAALALLSGGAAAAPARATPSRTAHGSLADPCPCKNPICRPGCSQQ
jgi:hypothetical protein